jgi:beta-lactam-binding protein with PASTA domain
MRNCHSCGRENPDERDFCECGEYLRWEPTGFVKAVTPEMAAEAAARARPAPASSAKPPDDRYRTVVQPAVAPPQPAPFAPAAEGEDAAMTLRLPEGEAVKGVALQVDVVPGECEQVLALVRNQSGIVDNYELRLDGLPAGWWSVYPDTVYLVPFGSDGIYEQEVELRIHPPRTPEAEARPWQLRLVAFSKAQQREATAAPLELTIHPYTETTTSVRPQRRSGRRKADFDVEVENSANAPVLVALEGTDPEGTMRFGFNRPPQEIRPGDSVTSTMRVRPPKQIWIGRPVDHRLEVTTLTGEDAEERLAVEPLSAEQAAEAASARGRWRRKKIPGFYGPRVFKPQVMEPGLSIGPGGIRLREPRFRAPRVRGPRMKQMNFRLSNLKGGGATPAAAAAPLTPSQAVFRQRPWVPWWLLPLLLMLLLLLFLLYQLLPRNVGVPDLVGAKSAFVAEQKLTEAQLRLDPQQKQQATRKANPGTVIGQTPAPGQTARKDSEVSILVAVSDGSVTVPKIVGMTATDADRTLREANLTLGSASPQPVDPKGRIESQIPAAKEIVKEGTPVNVFYPDPKAAAAKAKAKGGGASADGGGGGSGVAAKIRVPPIDGAELAAYAKKVSDEKLVPETVRSYDGSKPGTVFATDPPENTEVAQGTKVTLRVSAGFPQIAFDDGKDVRLINGFSGKKLAPIAKGPERESDPTFKPDGTRLAYSSDGVVFLANLEKPDEKPIALSGKDQDFLDLSWAPTTDVNVLAMAGAKGDDRDLCFGRITADGMGTGCIEEPDFAVTSAIRWRPNGKLITATAVRSPGRFGIVRWRSDKPFSADPNDWGKGRFITDTNTPNKGVIDAALSPDGKRLALVANTRSSNFFRLYMTKPGDFTLEEARATTVRACKAAWRSDSREIVVVQADEACSEDVGSLIRLSPDDPRQQTELSAFGDNPEYQPLPLGG